MQLKKVLKVFAAALAITALEGGGMHAAGKTDNPYGEPFRLECTAYYEGEVTASGQEVREGICAGKREWLGLTCIMYEDDGGKPGACIDVYMPGREECMEWGRRTVWVQLVEAEG